METGQIILIIIVVVVVLAVIGLVVAMSRKRRAAQNRDQAAGLRQDAQAKQSGVAHEDLKAREAELEAERKRLEAERAESRAAETRKGQQQEHAKVEDQVREADRIDPDVDHRGPDYQPRATDEPGHTPTTEHRAAEDPVHEQPVTDDGTTGGTNDGTGGTHRS